MNNELDFDWIDAYFDMLEAAERVIEGRRSNE